MVAPLAVVSKETDRRVIRTKKLLRDALTELIAESGFDSITVCDLTQRADINRGTFYTHYKDKHDLLKQNEEETVADILRIQKAAQATTLDEVLYHYREKVPLPLYLSLFDYIRENGKFLKAVAGPNGDPAFFPLLKETMLRASVKAGAQKDGHFADFSGFYLAYHFNAQVGLVQYWLATEMKETSEEMALLALAITLANPSETLDEYVLVSNNDSTKKAEYK